MFQPLAVLFEHVLQSSSGSSKSASNTQSLTPAQLHLLQQAAAAQAAHAKAQAEAQAAKAAVAKAQIPVKNTGQGRWWISLSVSCVDYQINLINLDSVKKNVMQLKDDVMEYFINCIKFQSYVFFYKR